jgi:SRSO17 transposase
MDGRRRRSAKRVEVELDRSPIEGSAGDLGPIEILEVCGGDLEHVWDYLVRTHHFLGCTKMFGPRLKYLAFAGGRPVAAASWNRAALSVGAREDFIGWSLSRRRALLPSVINNNRLLIPPWVKVKNLASLLLSRTLKLAARDWARRFGVRPIFAEAFVDLSRHKGVCYRAANWIYAGETKGFAKAGKSYVYHGRRKGVFLYPLQKGIFQKLESRPPIRRTLKSKDRGATAMQLQNPQWSETLLRDAGAAEEAVAGLEERLSEFLRPFDGAYSRQGQSTHGGLYVRGLLSGLERKSVEPIALNTAGEKAVRPMERFLQKGKWDEGAMLRTYQEQLSELVSDEDGMITIDGCDFPKKGKCSIGVARQRCGPLGKTDSCQAGVFAGYSGAKGYGPIEGRLYMPQKWFDADHDELREKCGAPEDPAFKTKLEIASEMLDKTVKSGLFQARWVGVDSAFGDCHEFLDSIPEGLSYFADVPAATLVFKSTPEAAIPEYKGRGRKPTKAVPSFAPVSVKSIAEDESAPWKDTVFGEGAKGPIAGRSKAVRVVECRGGLPGEEIWLFIRKLSDGTDKYTLSSAPADCPAEKLESLSIRRWPIEQCFEECKSELGMDHCECRSWNAYHRHIILVFVAYLFLLTLRFEFTKKKRGDVILTLSQARMMMKICFDMLNPVDCGKRMKIIDYYIRRAFSSYESHKRRKKRA